MDIPEGKPALKALLEQCASHQNYTTCEACNGQGRIRQPPAAKTGTPTFPRPEIDATRWTGELPDIKGWWRLHTWAPFAASLHCNYWAFWIGEDWKIPALRLIAYWNLPDGGDHPTQISINLGGKFFRIYYGKLGSKKGRT